MLPIPSKNKFSRAATFRLSADSHSTNFAALCQVGETYFHKASIFIGMHNLAECKEHSARDAWALFRPLVITRLC
jgi:hypothetical protein